MSSHGVPRSGTIAHRTEQQLQEEQLQIQEYKDLEALIRTKVAERQYTLEVLHLTSKLLKKNPEYYTIWNVRRRLLIFGLFSESSHSSSSSKEPSSSFPTVTTSSSSGRASSHVTTPEDLTTTPHSPASQIPGKSGTITDLIQGELEFLFPIMMKYPKCYWLWNYRLWVLRQANERLDPGLARDFWDRELILVGKMLVKDSRNFHGWGYRRIVVAQLESQKLHGKSLVESEFGYTTKVIHGLNGLSNFSAWHRRSKLIPSLLDERRADDATRQRFLENEFDLIIRAMYTDSYPYAQSAWFYYQFLMTTVTDSMGHASITPNWTLEDRAAFVTRQLSVLIDMLDGAEDCKWTYDALVEYTLALCRMEERQLRPDERRDCQSWLTELRKLDRLRCGRWGDLEMSLLNS